MNIFRLHAYTVEPTRTAESRVPPVGGEIEFSNELLDALNRHIRTARFDARILVDFQVDPTTRTNETRDQILSYAFSDDPEADLAGQFLAARLSSAMDYRSTPALFVVVAARDDSQRSVFLWTFPKDEAFRFRSGRGRRSIEILTDVFSQRSNLRKAARFRGRNLRNEFLSGTVLDFQVNQKSKPVADLWIGRFLQCGFALRGDAGTRLVARAFRASIDSCRDPAEQQQIFDAMRALCHSPQTRWSPREIADAYLNEVPKQTFLDSIPNPETRSTTFEFQADVFDRVVRFRIFELDTGVLVSSPLDEVGRSVIVEGDTERRLTCTGLIVDEKVRARHA